MNTSNIRALVAAAGLLLASQAQAVIAIPCTLLTATSGANITVNECRGSFGWQSEYVVNNPSDTLLYGLFVSTQANGSQQQAIAARRSGWQAEYLSEAAWNTAYQSVYGLSFDSVFGTEDTGAFYMLTNNEAAGLGAADGSVLLASFGAQPTSNFLALGTGNTVIASSFIPASSNAVPEPAGFGLAAFGLLAAAAARRRRAG